VPKSVIGITLGSESESEEEEIYSTSSITMDVVPRMFKGVERGVGPFKLMILKLWSLSLRSVMESLQAVGQKVSLLRSVNDGCYEIDYSQPAVAYIYAPILKSAGEKGSRSCGP
jgi:hypothetical protein